MPLRRWRVTHHLPVDSSTRSPWNVSNAILRRRKRPRSAGGQTFLQAVGNDGQRLVNLFVSDDERRQKSQYVSVQSRFDQDQPRLLRAVPNVVGQRRVGFPGFWIFYQLDSLHRPNAADIPDGGKSRRQLLETGFKPRSHTHCPLQQAV